MEREEKPEYHQPVLAKTILNAIWRNDSGTYLDGTLGGGGHAELFLEKLSDKGKYIGIDRDKDALKFASQRLSRFSNFYPFYGVFDRLPEALESAGQKFADAILLDLGVSSYQIDTDKRGFGFRDGLFLDMRMDSSQPISAVDILNGYTQDELTKIFKEYGEERYSYYIAKKIVKERKSAKIVESARLLKIIESSVPGKFKIKSFAKIFQALRIEVNNELEILKTALKKSVDALNIGGKLAVISYHSLEDKIVKQFIAGQENPCICPRELPQCICGKQPKLKRNKPYLITADEEEVKRNNRARSAKLRIGERV
jgi:16S rRNA (cytosine1402-N4)-methyltransferase